MLEEVLGTTEEPPPMESGTDSQGPIRHQDDDERPDRQGREPPSDPRRDSGGFPETPPSHHWGAPTHHATRHRLIPPTLPTRLQPNDTRSTLRPGKRVKQQLTRPRPNQLPLIKDIGTAGGSRHQRYSSHLQRHKNPPQVARPPDGDDPHPGKPTHLVKSWRPIVVANTVGKLAQKVIANRLQLEHSSSISSSTAPARAAQPSTP